MLCDDKLDENINGFSSQMLRCLPTLQITLHLNTRFILGFLVDFLMIKFDPLI